MHLGPPFGYLPQVSKRQDLNDHCYHDSLHRGSSVFRAAITAKCTRAYISTIFRSADYIGMMRAGKLLAEDSPLRLLEIYNKPNLESVFLHLCVSDDTDAVETTQTPK